MKATSTTPSSLASTSPSAVTVAVKEVAATNTAVIIQPNNNDVLSNSGKGYHANTKTLFNHHGNAQFRKIVASTKETYKCMRGDNDNKSSENRNRNIFDTIIDTVTTSQSSADGGGGAGTGRFLKLNRASGVWRSMTHREARQLIRNELRRKVSTPTATATATTTATANQHSQKKKKKKKSQKKESRKMIQKPCSNKKGHDTATESQSQSLNHLVPAIPNEFVPKQLKQFCSDPKGGYWTTSTSTSRSHNNPARPHDDDDDDDDDAKLKSSSNEGAQQRQQQQPTSATAFATADTNDKDDDEAKSLALAMALAEAPSLYDSIKGGRRRTQKRSLYEAENMPISMPTKKRKKRGRKKSNGIAVVDSNSNGNGNGDNDANANVSSSDSGNTPQNILPKEKVRKSDLFLEAVQRARDQMIMEHGPDYNKNSNNDDEDFDEDEVVVMV